MKYEESLCGEGMKCIYQFRSIEVDVYGMMNNAPLYSVMQLTTLADIE